MPMNRLSKKKLLRVAGTVLLSVLALLLMLGGTACGRKGPPPELEDVYDRIVEVVETSQEVNVLLFGAGLPVYERGDAEDALVHRYYGVPDNGREYVTPYAKFLTVEAMEAAVTQVYGSEYRTSLMQSLFTGYADSDVSLLMPARYYQDSNYLYQNDRVKPLVSGLRLYDYAGMKIEEGSYATYLRVSIPSYSEDQGEWERVTLSFVYENSNWYLDSPSC